MSNKKFLLWPWENWKGSIEKVLDGLDPRVTFTERVNHIEIDMITRKYDEIKKGEVFPNKREQSLEYVLRHWPEDHPKRVAIQAGGCLGLWPKVLSYYFDTVYTFEAQAEAFFFLSLNCPERNIVKMQMALGDKGGEFIDIPMTNKPGQGTVAKGGSIPTITIDSLNLYAVDALLLDVEGHEPQVLQGALKTIGRCKPYILCEDNWNSNEIARILKDVGYELITKANKDKIFKHKSKSWPGGQWDKHSKGDKK